MNTLNIVLLLAAITTLCSCIEIPIIDLEETSSEEGKQGLAIKLGKACEEVGFFIVVGHGIDQNILDNTWNITRKFFDLNLEEKVKFELDQVIYPFGYTSLGGEVLSSGKNIDSGYKVKNYADLKEMFSM